MTHLSAPLRRSFALFLLSGGSSLTLLQWLLDAAWRSLGWLSASPESPPLRRLWVGLRRWHFAAGGCCAGAACGHHAVR